MASRGKRVITRVVLRAEAEEERKELSGSTEARETNPKKRGYL